MLQTYREPGLVGSWIGQLLFGNWGPQFAGMALVPSVFGDVLLVAIFLVLDGTKHLNRASIGARFSLPEFVQIAILFGFFRKFPFFC